MSWDRDPLWAKARLYFERAFNTPRDEPVFGLWCAMGLELLARAAVASVSPTLLAEPDAAHRHLLHALGHGSKGPPRSIGTAQVMALCRTLFSGFTEADQALSMALINRRNEELHTGTAAFAAYSSNHWLRGFYSACNSLTTAMNESLESLFGKEEAKVAQEILAVAQGEVRSKVESAIAAHRKVFEAKSPEDQEKAQKEAAVEGEKLAFLRHHRVTCPACKSVATVQGEPFGPENVSLEHGIIDIRQSVSPRSFSCPACGLKLQGYAELEVAELAGHYTRLTSTSPEEYYGLLDPDSIDFDSYIHEYISENPEIIQNMMQEYDNE